MYYHYSAELHTTVSDLASQNKLSAETQFTVITHEMTRY